MSVLAQMSTRDVLEELLSQSILLLDGSMGAYIFARKPTEQDPASGQREGNPRLGWPGSGHRRRRWRQSSRTA